MERDPIDGGIGLHQAKLEMEAQYKFRLFFAALIFAILSFAIQHPINNNNSFFLKIVEIFSWFTLFLSGYFSLVLCSGVSIGLINWCVDRISKWSNEERMWIFFYVSLFLLLLVKGIDRF